MTKAAKKTAYNILYAVIFIAIVFGVWAVAAKIIDVEFILPDIGTTFEALGELLSGRGTGINFYPALGGTVLRVAISFSIAFALYFILFFLSTAFDGFRKVIAPLISTLRSLPTMAIALVITIWAGGQKAPIVLSVAVIMPQLYSASLARNATVPRELGEVCSLCGANRAQRFFALYLPNAAAGLPESVSSALSFNVKIIIAAEILIQTKYSIGILMSYASYMTATLIALTFAAVVLSVSLEWITKIVLRRALARFCDV